MEKFKNFVNLYWKKIAIIVTILILDIVTKMFFEGKNFELIPNIIQIYSTHNTGAAFSIFTGKVVYLVLFSLVFLTFMIFYDIKSKNNSKLYLLSIGMIMAGAIGNLLDRIFLGYVRDFINFEFINFPVFNVADISLTIGTVLLVVYLLFFTKGDKNAKNNNSNN